MKLYTEEQVKRLYEIAYLSGYGKYIMDFEEDIKQVTAIEIPATRWR
jgi:H2-forming N5,N10-methylenetetrahydromethanopterin dehydrogenase-like enzyme